VRVTPVTLREARSFVAQHHRHHEMPQGGLFGIAASAGDVVQGVVIVGLPVARKLRDGFTAEVTRLCVWPVCPIVHDAAHPKRECSHDACSMLYAAAWRAAKALGYRRLVTYTLATEPGTSLRAAGWRCLGEAGGGSWSRASRPRVDTHPLQLKLRWEA
jgi:hypothetical protein